MTGANGCDSTVTTVLVVNVATTSTSTHTACDTYTWNGTAYTSSGSYTYSTTNANGCDSTATLNLTINSSTSSTNNQTVCYGGSYSINGNTYNATGTYTDVFTNAAGCDSTVTTNLTVLNQLSVSIYNITSTTICSGSSVTLSIVGGGNYTYQWSDANGAISGCLLYTSPSPRD